MNASSTPWPGPISWAAASSAARRCARASRWPGRPSPMRPGSMETISSQAVREGFQMAWQAFPDAAWLDGDHFVHGDRGVSESTFRGTKADGLRVEARMVDVFTFKDGKIAVKNAFRKDRPPVAAA